MSQNKGTSGGLPEQVEVQEVEQLLQQITAISGCRVVCNEWGAVEEIHILSDTSRHPKQVVRDVESALAARWNLEVDHKKISVAQVDKGEQEGPSSSPAEHVSVVSVNVMSRLPESTMEAEVTLRWSDDKEIMGSHEGTAPTVQSGRIPAKAAVAAVRHKLKPGCGLTLEDLQRVRMSGGDVVVCQMGFSSPRGEMEILVGCAPADSEDPTYAAVQAVLHAVNSNRERFS